MCVSGERLVVNSYVPAIVPLAGVSGGRGRIIVEGGYPFLPQATLRIELPAPESLTVDFRLPAEHALEVRVNGVVQDLQKTREGLFRLRRVWSSQDQVSLRFDWPLCAHFQTASDGVRWAAFSWGPLVLAQSVLKQTDHPENVLTAPRVGGRYAVGRASDCIGQASSALGQRGRRRQPGSEGRSSLLPRSFRHHGVLRCRGRSPSCPTSWLAASKAACEPCSPRELKLKSETARRGSGRQLRKNSNATNCVEFGLRPFRTRCRSYAGGRDAALGGANEPGRRLQGRFLPRTQLCA